MKNKMMARMFGGDYYDDEYLRGANLDADCCIGLYAVLQESGIALGIGETPELAIADAKKNIGEPIEIVDDRRPIDGECECVLIEEDL